MSRVSKKKLLKILQGEYDPPSMSKESVLEYLNKKSKYPFLKKDEGLKIDF